MNPSPEHPNQDRTRRRLGRGFVVVVYALLAPLLMGMFVMPGCDWAAGELDGLTAEPDEQFSGGLGTVFETGKNAFGLPAPGLTRSQERFFGVGNSFFNQNWVSAPASTTARDGLGPFFNARSCASCHFRDGRGRSPAFDGERPTGYLVRVALPETRDEYGRPVGDERYGTQIQDGANLDFAPEASIRIRYETITGTYDDGTTYTLRKPSISFADEAYGPITSRALSGRVANHISGMGLLESIPDETLLALADPDDADGDGVSGRVNMVWDVRKQGYSIGRFGWKAEQPTVEQQVASAFHGDMGLTSSLFSDENCSEAAIGCTEAPNGGTPEIEDDMLEHTTLYSASLAVPARRDWDEPEVLRGKQLFREVGCVNCHVPQITTGINEITDAFSNQVIRPYTDLLLHDMGPELADDFAVFDANGREWRTPPLWGIGLIETVNGHTEFLHDGRARNLEEAILWHGGEADASRQRFKALSKDERDALIRFLRSL